MKAILVIDMPESCEECCCAYYTEGISHDYCKAVGYETDIEGYRNEPFPFPFDKEYKGKRPDWCPLKPLPRRKYKKEKRDWYNYASPYLAGWNECIDEILGEEE